MSAPVDVLAVMDYAVSRWVHPRASDLEEARDAVGDLIEAARTGYAILADIHNHWPGRHTREGQLTLYRLRDGIAAATGADPEDVQNEASERAALARVGGAK